MQRRRQIGLAVVTVLALTGTLTIATTTAASATPPGLSSMLAINQYLADNGITNAVWQTGQKNYAGPFCPGAGWNCRAANVPIVQFATLANSTNLFLCLSPNCMLIQVATVSGQNGGACFRGDGSANVLQVCEINQVNTGSPNSTNAAVIAQHIQQTRGSEQRARQIARITQTNETGSNIARIIQGIGQSSRVTGGSPTQVQEGHQAGTVTQTTESDDPAAALGDNTSNIRQIQDQLERASGGGPFTTVMQDQNTDTTGTDPTCDQPGDTTFQAKNQCAQVIQHSGLIGVGPPPDLAAGGGENRSTLNQQTTQRQFADTAGTVNQSQGAFSTGEAGTKEQLSSGVSTSTASQDTVQNQTAPLSGTVVTQTQNTGDPRCCQTQEGNPNNTADITQTTNQSSGDNAVQDAMFVGHCDTSGTCNVQQSSTINGSTDTNSCTDTDFCNEVLTCTQVEGETQCVFSD